MSWSAEWVRDWLGEKRRSQASFAKLCGIGADNVSRWLSGQSKPDREAVERLLRYLPPDEGASFLVAWLRDLLPPGAERLVRVEPASSSWSDSYTLKDHDQADGGAPAFPHGMSEDLKRRLLFFGELAVLNPDVRKILDVCYQALQRSKRGSGTSPSD